MWQERELSDDADQVCLYCPALIVVFLFSPLRFTDSLHRAQGCAPSKVRLTASQNEACFAF
jgi:hypothetical protein